MPDLSDGFSQIRSAKIRLIRPIRGPFSEFRSPSNTPLGHHFGFYLRPKPATIRGCSFRPRV